jgi:transcription elongation factor GreB
VVDPAQQKNRDRVFFGATVIYANSADEENTVTIVGIDEADLDKGRVSWLSPIARAMMKAEEGDRVELHSPGGTESLKIVSIRYPD